MIVERFYYKYQELSAMLLFLSSLIDNWIELGDFGLKVFDLLFIFIAIFKIFYSRLKLYLIKSDLYLSYAIIFYFCLSIFFYPEQLIRNIYILFVFLFSYLFGRNINRNLVLKILRINIIIWITGFYFQFFYFQIFGDLLNLTVFTTQYLRVDIYNKLMGVRYTSFAIEPYSFASVISLLLLGYLTFEYNDKNLQFRNFKSLDITLIILSLLAAYLSGSFFALISIPAFIILFIPSFWRTITKFRNLRISSILILTLIISFTFYNLDNIKYKVLSRLTTERLVALDIADETSLSKNRSFYDRTARLISNECISNLKNPKIIIGTGLDTVKYHSKCGVNMFSYLALNFGIIGNIILYFFLYSRLNSAFRAWMLFTSPFLFPMIGTVFFPLILGMMAKEKRN